MLDFSAFYPTILIIFVNNSADLWDNSVVFIALILFFIQAQCSKSENVG